MYGLGFLGDLLGFGLIWCFSGCFGLSVGLVILVWFGGFVVYCGLLLLVNLLADVRFLVGWYKPKTLRICFGFCLLRFMMVCCVFSAV